MAHFIATIFFLLVVYFPFDCFIVNLFYWINPDSEWFKQCYFELPKFLRFINKD